MSTVGKNIVTQGLSGMLGDMIVFRQVGDRTIVGSRPTTKNRVPTAKQAAHKERFQQAVIYAKSALAMPDLKVDYEEQAGNGITAYNIAVADFLSAPNIVSISLADYYGQVGDKIMVRVTDDFKVKEVKIIIMNPDGSLVESGNAVQQDFRLDWVYTATAVNAQVDGDKLIIQATDTPGNLTEKETIL
ncbi:MAG: hypothetical protein LCH54_18035 [Bacteroidetes bacterium]|nr:hypothetical protein [Bacteroidota bacterium]